MKDIREKKVIYYSDPMTEEFSEARITPRVIDGSYKYKHNILWELCSLLIQNVFSMPVKRLYMKIKFRHRCVGTRKLEIYRDSGYFIYGNHTQPFADTLIPSVANYPKRNFFIVSPANVSIPGIGWLVELLGAIPVPCDLEGMKHFISAVENRVKKKHSVTIYPEAHIWPYYTHIRPFKDVSFKYPVNLNAPVFAMTNTYHARGKNQDKVQIITFFDGPFFPDKSLPPRKRQQVLRDQVYRCMVERSKESDFEFIEYRKKSDRDPG